MSLPSVEHYEELALTYELTVQQLLQAHPYNTVGNFIRFYGDYRKGVEWSLRDFYEAYIPELVEGEYTCVGLGLELIGQLRAGRSGLELGLVSCEEAVDSDLGFYGGERPAPLAEKEHVLVCGRVSVAGRRGLLLLDPGYHVARTVTIMEDQAYPHTGWFTQSNEPWVKREYRYFFPDHTINYVVWEVKETRRNVVKTTHNLIYVGDAFENAVEFTEKRNLVYNFKSWLARNIKGEIMAGLYFSLDGNSSDNFTVMCTDSNANKQRLKFHFSDFLINKKFSPEETYVLEICGQQLGMSTSFQDILCTLAGVMADSEFITQVIDINEEINSISP